jgi:drug/metabolite transporter (DMT)-like permease
MMSGPLAAFLASCTWAIGSSNYAKLTRSYRPFDINFTRALFAFPFFIVAIIITQGGFVPAWETIRATPVANIGWLSLSIIASYAIGDIFFLWSTIALGNPGALAIASSYPILMALAGVVFEGQSLAAHQWGGSLLAVSGIIIVILKAPTGVRIQRDPEADSTISPHLRKRSVGVVCGLLTAFFWALNGYSVSKGGAQIDPLVGGMVRMAASLLLISSLSLCFTRKIARPLPAVVRKKMGWVFVVESFLGSCFFVYGLSRSPLVLGGMLSSLAPVLAVPVSIALKLERFSWIRTFALLLVIAGLSLIFS